MSMTVHGLSGRSVAAKLSAHRFDAFFPKEGNWSKSEFFGETVHNKKFSAGKFCGASTNEIRLRIQKKYLVCIMISNLFFGLFGEISELASSDTCV